MREIQFRSAVVSDLPTLLEFEQKIIKVERPFDVTLKPDPISYYDLKEMILSDQAEVFVATAGDQIVGSAYAKIKEALPYLNHENYAYLGFMYVVPEYRGQGINGKIIDEISIWVKSKNLTELRLNVYDQNHTAIRAYEKAGFEKHITTMRIDIGKNE